MATATMTMIAGHPAPFRRLHGPNASSDLCCVQDAQGAELTTAMDCGLATLFAATPDLLALATKGTLSAIAADLRSIVNRWDEWSAEHIRAELTGLLSEVIDPAIVEERAAIAKAEGRT